MRRWLLLVMLLLLCCSLPAYAQQADSTRGRVRQQLEDALESFDPDNPNLDTEQLTQILQDLASNPLDLNRASSNKLLIIPGVNLKRARSIIKYRQHVKPFESVKELRNVTGIGRATLERMRPYVTVGSGLQLSKALYTNPNYWIHDGDFTAFSRYRQTIQQQTGYVKPDSAGGYLGGPQQYYQRFTYRSDHLSLNLTQQKDAGEPLAGTTGFDFNSFHLALEDNGQLREFVVGDYALYFGQGMVLWNGRTFGKGRDVIGTVDRNGRGIHPYSSSQESDFYRGVAATVGRELQFTGFYSNRNQSASSIASDTTRLPQQNGYHRTKSERDNRNNLLQIAYGGHLQLNLPFGIIGATGYRTIYDKFIFSGDRISDLYDFNGRQNSVFGLDYKFLAGPAIIFGEGGRSKNGGTGFISGLESPIGLNTELTLAYRHYSKDFQSVLGNGFGESSGSPKNEEGVYIGLQNIIDKYVTVSAYFDQYQFPAPRFSTSQPTHGHDWLGLVEVNLNEDVSFYLQARNEIKEDEFSMVDRYGRERTRLGNAERGSLRGQLAYQVNPQVRLRSRGEVIRSQQAGANLQYGYLLYQDMRFKPSSKLTFDARITLFDTDSYDTRLYQFENGLLYVLSNQVLYGQGQRIYAVINYEPLFFLEVWAKFGVTIFQNRQTISSGLGEIQGRKRSNAGVEVRLQF